MKGKLTKNDAEQEKKPMKNDSKKKREAEREAEGERRRAGRDTRQEIITIQII